MKKLLKTIKYQLLKFLQLPYFNLAPQEDILILGTEIEILFQMQ